MHTGHFPTITDTDDPGFPRCSVPLDLLVAKTEFRLTGKRILQAQRSSVFPPLSINPVLLPSANQRYPVSPETLQLVLQARETATFTRSSQNSKRKLGDHSAEPHSIDAQV